MAAWTDSTGARADDGARLQSVEYSHVHHDVSIGKRVNGQRGRLSNHDLVMACLNGSDVAWQEMITRYSRLVYSITRHYGLTTLDADDIFQNVFIKVFRHLAHLRDASRLSAWLISTTHHECLTFEARQTTPAELSEELGEDDSLLLDHVSQTDLQRLVRRAMGELDAPSQRLLTALFFETASPSYQEISRRLGIPTGSIGPMRARSLKKLKVILGPLHPDD
ncbi:MAG: sigma-70 family RNA polymerase sigma factor [Anaerolineae bacterium]